jgi:hypothetical protein
MKLRLQANSIRLRLKQGEVARLVESGRLEEKIVFATGPEQAFTYILETVEGRPAPHAELSNDTVHVRISAETARQWATGNEVGIEEHQPLSPDHSLHLLIEKDFACLDRNDADNTDTYPHPSAGLV